MTAALVAGFPHNNETGAATVAPKDTAQAQPSAGRTRSDSGYRAADTAAVKTRMNDSTSSAGAATSDTMSMPRDSSSMKRDSTGANGTASAADSTSNQTKSGATDTKTGKSTLGKGV